MKRMTRFCLIFIMVFTVTMPAFAADGNVIYSGDSGEFIFEPGSNYSPTDLFPNFKDVMPGDTLSQTIMVKNNAKKNVKISMRALGAHEDSVDFLSKLNLFVEKVTNTTVFEAAADQTAQLTEWQTLGVLTAGGEAELAVVLHVPTELDNNYQELIGYLDWEFMVEEIDDGAIQTGDRTNYWPWFIGLVCSALAIMIIVIVFAKRSRKEMIVNNHTEYIGKKGHTETDDIDDKDMTSKGGTA